MTKICEADWCVCPASVARVARQNTHCVMFACRKCAERMSKISPKSIRYLTPEEFEVLKIKAAL